MLSRVGQKLRRFFRFNAIRLFRLRGSSERVARGFALGLIVNFFPSFGFGVLISGFVARLFGGNALAGFIGGATLTFFWMPLFFLNVRVGSLVFRPHVRVEEMDDVTERTINALVLGRTFAVGAVLNSIVVGLFTYFLVYTLHTYSGPRILAWLRRHRRRRLARRDSMLQKGGK
jgi:uncharacterized protein (DUF2062 family)